MNYFPIKTFLGQQNDCELNNLIPFLIWLSNKPDVRPVCDLYNEYRKIQTNNTAVETLSQEDSDKTDDLTTDRRRDQPSFYHEKIDHHSTDTRKQDCVFSQEPTTPRTTNSISFSPQVRKSIRNLK